MNSLFARSLFALGRQLQIVEDTLKSVAFRGGTHDADVDSSRWNEVSHAHRSKVLAIFRTESLENTILVSLSEAQTESEPKQMLAAGCRECIYD